MKILVGGASGFVGNALTSHLKKTHQVYTLVRDRAKVRDNTCFWDIDALKIETDIDFDIVINLAGENIGMGRWSKRKKQEILNSRVNATNTIARFFSFKKTPPQLVINASATGYYGSREAEILTEATSKGTGFLADVCEQWEKALLPIKDRGTRTVFLRSGVILGKEGGAIKRLLTPFKLCLGGTLGDGSQYMAWVDLEDLVHAVDHIIEKRSIEGAVNMVAPNPVTNKVFTEELAKAINRPALFPVPKSVIKLIFGEMGEEVLLTSQRAIPEKLISSGYQFRYPTIDSSFDHVIKVS